MTGKDAGEVLKERATLHGSRFEGLDASAWRGVLADATDYRGDVTIRLTDGTSVTGYLYSHEPRAPEPHVKVLPSFQGSARLIVPIANVAALEFSGDDKASGRSWESWVRRYEEKKQLLAQGIDIGEIEPQPDDL